MSEAIEPYSQDELIAALAAIHREGSELFAAFSPSDFFGRPEPEVWSPGENAIHLVKSVKAVADAMKMPKLALRGMFGRADGSRSYAEVREVYRQALADGTAVAGGRYLPPDAPTADAAGASQARAVTGWQRAGASLEKALAGWSEKALDSYRLPHPILGKMTVREMLCFTHYHDLHHLETVRRLRGG